MCGTNTRNKQIGITSIFSYYSAQALARPSIKTHNQHYNEFRRLFPTENSQVMAGCKDESAANVLLHTLQSQ